jgi:hypothetical protein
MADGTPFKVTVGITPSLEEIAEKYRFTPRQVQQIGTVAVNRSLATANTSIVRRLAGAINIDRKTIGESIAVRKATYEKLSGSVTVSRRPVPLIDFIGTVQTPAGVSVLVRKDGPRQILGGTFIATMKTGHAGVFERRFEGSKAVYAGRRVPRLPIFERFGLTLAGYLANAPQVVAEEQAKAGQSLGKNVLSQVSRHLAKQPIESA